jgi:sigma-54 dependent transcriptional regulator, acetoin dehydrogenase operon transcriptional activator AcoR
MRRGTIMRRHRPIAMTPCPASNDRLGSIAGARRALLHEGHATQHSAIEPWIAASWQRCIGRGRRPHDGVDFDVISRAALRRADESSRALRSAAEPVLADLDRAIAPTRYFSLLTDAQGVVVCVGATADAAAPAVRAIARRGVDLSEGSVGTTAISAALGELHPVWLHRGEHFFDATSIYSCAGAPIVGVDGGLVGMLDLTGVMAQERPELRHLATQMALRIESALLQALPHWRVLQVQWPGGSTGAGLLVLNADGVIIGADRVARAMLALQWNAAASHYGPLDGCFATSPSRLLGLPDGAPGQAVPLWSGLQVLVAWSDPLAPAARAPGARWRESETHLIRQAIDAAQGNVARAAAQLGLSRATMYRRLALLRRRGV